MAQSSERATAGRSCHAPRGRARKRAAETSRGRGLAIRLRSPARSRYIDRMSQENLGARAALARLVEGNQRYIKNVRSVDSMLSHSRRDVQSQQPFAIILGCSDSRAPAELVFDQGLGDLFVIRV